MRNRVFFNSSCIQYSIVLGLMMALALSLAGCGGGNGSSSNNNTGNGSGSTVTGNPALATITGVVQDTSSSHNPVAGAVITVTGTGRTATTDAAGTFVVTNVPLNATSFSVASPNTLDYYNYANYNGKVYNLVACTLPLPTLAAGANAPFTEIDMYIGGSNAPPPSLPTGCPS
jgi:hypothetical protein